MAELDYVCADSVAHALSLAQRSEGETYYIAGGTDFMLKARRGKLVARRVIDVSRISGMRKVVLAEADLIIGAATTHKEIEKALGPTSRCGALFAASKVIGGHQVRNVATVGGNIMNASPAADVVVALLALGARVRLASDEGTRTAELTGFFVGPGATCAERGELLTEVLIPRPRDHQGSNFLKFGRRKAMEISVVCVATSLSISERGTIQNASVALGAVGPTPFRARTAEDILEGMPPSDALFELASHQAALESRPRTDVRASSSYRMRLVEILVKRSLHASLIDCGV